MAFEPEVNYYPITIDSSTKEGTPEEPQANTANMADTGTVKESGGSAKITQNSIQSINYIKGQSGWFLSADGILYAIGAVISGTITAIAGAIGGWILSATKLSSTSGNVELDSANEKIIVGDIELDGATSTIDVGTLTIDGVNSKIESDDYVAGVSGVHLSPNLLESENIVGRATLKGAVFSYDIVSAVGGQLLVTNSDTLDADTTALDASTFTTKGETTFAVNDILLLRARTALGIQEEYIRVTNIGSAPTYTVTRDLAGTFTSDINPIWKKGTAVVKVGSSDGASTYSGGWLRLIGEGTNAPYYSVFKRTGVAYNAFTEYCRLGNLNGFLNYSSDEYGIAIGEANKFLKYDPTNGLRIRGITESTVVLEAGEDITVGDGLRIFSDGKVYKSFSNISSATVAFIGFATNTVSAGGDCIVQISNQFTTSGLTAGSVYYLSDGTTDQSNVTNNNEEAVYSGGTIYGQTFTTGGSTTKLNWVEIYGRKVGSGAGNLTINIYATSSSLPTGASLGTSEVVVSGDLSTSNAWIGFSFGNITLSSGTEYALVISASGGDAGGNNFTWRKQDTNVYANGQAVRFTASWAALGLGEDFTFKTGFSLGTIATTAGSVSKKIGLSLSTTLLNILNS